jgi:hypothetical protein
MGVAPAAASRPRARERNADDIVGVYWGLAPTCSMAGWMGRERPAKLRARSPPSVALICMESGVLDKWMGIGSSAAR